MSMEKTSSFSVVLNEHCGPNRGEEKLIFLRECKQEISNHLRRCHLSRENVTEIDLILARAGLFDLSASKVKEMTVCPNTETTLAGIGSPPEPVNTQNTPGSLKKLKLRRNCNQLEDLKGDLHFVW